MRVCFLVVSAMGALRGSAGFMLKASPTARTVGVESPAQQYKGQLPKTRVYTPVPVVLRMKGEGTAEDGGGSDGAALAEARIVVNGQATGGYFRAHARMEAHFNRKLCGALKELEEGRTEIIVEGKTSAIRSFLRWCKKGPGLSQQIQDVTVDWTEYTGIFDGFEVFPDEKAQNRAAGVP